MKSRKIIATAIAIFCLAAAAAQAQMVPLFVIPTETPYPDAMRDKRVLDVRIFARDLPKLARTLGISEPIAGADSILYRLGQYPQLPYPTPTSTVDDWQKPSFVVDYDEPSVMELTKAFVAQEGPHADPTKLIQYVANLMAGKHGHGFDIASRVARDREGDCTEYTVLLTALARSLDIPARIVMGLVVVREDAQFQAYGHAWAEFRIGDRWQVADAALSNLSTPFYYLPFGVLADEGPGFTFAIAHLTPVWVQRVIVLPASGGDGKSK